MFKYDRTNYKFWFVPWNPMHSNFFSTRNVISRNFILFFLKKTSVKSIHVIDTVHSTCICGNNENSHSRFFGKNFVKATVLLKKLLRSWFHGIFFSVSEKEFLVLQHHHYFYGKINIVFVKVTVYLNKSWFHGIFLPHFHLVLLKSSSFLCICMYH